MTDNTDTKFFGRKIIHIDMDAFYASVEQRDNPELRNKPVIVGGSPDSRGVVSTCSYEARKFGIHSAMSSAKAYKLCSSAFFIRPNFEKYKLISKQINEIFHLYTDLVEPLSLDEAFLDVTENKKNIPSATIIAKKILSKIRKKTKLTASAGVSYNKFLAKVASDIDKPNGLTVITPEMAEGFIEKLPIRKFFGIGKVTEKKMYKLGINTGLELKKFSLQKLFDNFGKNGYFYYNIARGIDCRPVNPSRIRKSIGKEITLQKDINDLNKILAVLEKLCKQVAESIEKNKISARTVTLKLKYHDFSSITRNYSFSSYKFLTKNDLLTCMNLLIKKTEYSQKTVRLLGVTVSNFEDTNTEYYQPELNLCINTISMT